MIWKTSKPNEDVIVAQLVETWQSRYELLYLADAPYEHYYDDNGEEVPFSAIAKWASLQDEEAQKDLALTWEDIRTIFSLLDETARLLWFQNKKFNDKELCEETLRKFNKAKEDEQ